MRSISNKLAAHPYLNERSCPQPGERYYLSLSDLLLSLTRFASSGSPGDRILDYGAGGSPYRELFRDAVYERADLVAAAGDRLDYIIEPNRPLSARDASFDIVLSTQVAEHVLDVSAYFLDCFRLLRPGGTFYCSTHGHFMEHACPKDYWRWTADGLSQALLDAGFEVVRAEKLTTGRRAWLSIVEMMMHLDAPPKWTPAGFFWRIVRRLMHAWIAAIHRAFDRAFPADRLVDRELERHALYVGVVAIGRKPLVNAV